MHLRVLVSVSAICILSPISILADAIVEGRVSLPKSHAPPVMAKRYEIITTGGVLATEPPLAVVYLDGSFSKPTSQPTKQIAQKDLAFLPSLLPVRAGTRVEFPNLDEALSWAGHIKNTGRVALLIEDETGRTFDKREIAAALAGRDARNVTASPQRG